MALFCALFPILEGISNEYVAVGSTGLGAVVACVWIFESLFKGVRVNGGVVLFAFYLLWNGLSVNWTIDLQSTMDRVFGLGLSFVFYLMVSDTVRSRPEIVLVMRAFSYGVGILGLTAFYNLQQGVTYQSLYGRYSGAGFDPNNFAVTAASTVPMLLYLSRLSGPIGRLGHIGWVLALIVLCVASGSRSGTAAMIGALAGYFLFSLKISEWKNWVFYAAGAVAVVFFNLLLYIPEDSIERLMRSMEVGPEDDRVVLFHMAHAWGLENPMTGIGAGAFLSASGTFQPHNVLMGAFAELGIPGITMFGLFVAAHFLPLFRGKSLGPDDRLLRNVLAVSMGCVLVGLLTLNWEIRKPVYLIAGMLACFWSYKNIETTKAPNVAGGGGVGGPLMENGDGASMGRSIPRDPDRAAPAFDGGSSPFAWGTGSIPPAHVRPE